MNPSNRFSKDLLSNVEELPKSRTSYQYMTELFPHINEYIRLNKSKGTLLDQSKNKSSHKHKLNNDLAPSHSKRLRVSSENSDGIAPLSVKANEIILSDSEDETAEIKKESIGNDYASYVPDLNPRMPVMNSTLSSDIIAKHNSVWSSNIKKEPVIRGYEELPHYIPVPSNVKKEPIVRGYEELPPNTPVPERRSTKNSNTGINGSTLKSAISEKQPIRSQDKGLHSKPRTPEPSSILNPLPFSDVVIKSEPIEENELMSYSSSHLPMSTSMIKTEPVDDVEESLENNFLFSSSSVDIKKELKAEPDENARESTQLELNEMTASLLKIFINKELSANSLYPSFLKLCVSENIDRIIMANTPSLGIWRVNLYNFMRFMLQKYCHIHPEFLAMPYSDISLQDYYRLFMKYHESGGFGL